MNPIKSRGEMPPELEKQWKADLAALDRDEIDANFAKSDAAAAEDSFSGFVRRAVHAHGKTLPEVADEALLELERFAHFMRGEGLLDTAEVDRLLAALGIELPASTTR